MACIICREFGVKTQRFHRLRTYPRWTAGWFKKITRVLMQKANDEEVRSNQSRLICIGPPRLNPLPPDQRSTDNVTPTLNPILGLPIKIARPSFNKIEALRPSTPDRIDRIGRSSAIFFTCTRRATAPLTDAAMTRRSPCPPPRQCTKTYPN